MGFSLTTHHCCDEHDDPSAMSPVRAFVVRRGLAHVAARLVTDFIDVTERAVYGLLCIEDRTVRSMSVHDLTDAGLYIVEAGEARLDGTGPLRDGETVISQATITGEAVQLRCGGFRVRMTNLRLLPEAGLA